MAKYLSDSQAAAMLGVNETRLQWFVDTLQLDALGDGDQRRFRQGDVLNLLETYRAVQERRISGKSTQKWTLQSAAQLRRLRFEARKHRICPQGFSDLRFGSLPTCLNRIDKGPLLPSKVHLGPL